LIALISGISTASISTVTGNQSIELISNFTTIQGDNGSIVGIASTSTPNLAIEFTLRFFNWNSICKLDIQSIFLIH
jgi:hypothetical protein